MRDRLAAQRVVGEKRDAAKGNQEQSEQHGQRLHRGERQPKPALFGLGFLSERCAQFVGRLRHEAPQINHADDTTMGRIRAPCGAGKNGRFGRSRNGLREIRNKKGRPEGRPFECCGGFGQFAALLAGLSIAVLSPVAGAAVAVDLMPCSRSAAVFSALSSLASGGT